MIRSNFVIAILALCLFTPYAYGGEDTPPVIPDKENFKVFLLAGQSNMAGRGEITDEDLKVHPRVLMLAKDGSWKYAVDPIHYAKKSAGVGLAKSFAIELAERDKTATIGLVPAACSGSNIALWEPGAYFDKTDSHPYDDAIARTKRAMQDGTLSGILWHQGESDSTPERANVYRQKLTGLVERFRTDLNAAEVPFIIGQLGRFEAKPWTPERYMINEALIAVSQDVPFSGFVSSWGLTSKEDNSHFNTKSLHEFGQRYARRYLQVMSDGNSGHMDF